jgi:alpha-N-arabinofuranosidase
LYPSRRLLTIPLFATIFCSIVTSVEGQPPPKLAIDVGSVKGNVSPLLYGLMTEEINYSYDGGLYAELVRNRAFTDNRRMQPFHWFLYETGNADASMAMDMTTGPSAALPLSLAITIRSATDQYPAGVANEGYWGIAVRPDMTYQGSFYAKANDSVIGPITVSLINDDSAKVLRRRSFLRSVLSGSSIRLRFIRAPTLRLPEIVSCLPRESLGDCGSAWFRFSRRPTRTAPMATVWILWNISRR